MSRLAISVNRKEKQMLKTFGGCLVILLGGLVAIMLSMHAFVKG